MVDVTVWTAVRAASGNSDPPGDTETIVRKILGTTLAIDPASLRIERRCRICGHPTHGKPYAVGGPGLSLSDISVSVSHSANIVVVAVAHGTEVGVDVEVVRPRAYLDRLAVRILTPAEHAAWVELPEGERLEAFLSRWTEREAYLKAIGRGLRVPLRDVLANARGWTLEPLAGLPGAVGTVAFEGAGRVRTAPYPPVP